MRLRRLFTGVILLVALVATAGAQAQTFRSFEGALSHAETAGRPVLVDVWAPWCGWCHRMKQEVYPALPDSLTEAVVWTRVNRDDGETHHRYRGRRLSARQLAKELGAEGVPAIIFLSPDGGKLFETAGFLSRDQLQPVLSYVATRSYRRMSYSEFRRQRAGSP